MKDDDLDLDLNYRIWPCIHEIFRAVIEVLNNGDDASQRFIILTLTALTVSHYSSQIIEKRFGLEALQACLSISLVVGLTLFVLHD